MTGTATTTHPKKAMNNESSRGRFACFTSDIVAIVSSFPLWELFRLSRAPGPHGPRKGFVIELCG
jgi:hypothetical protein